MTGDRKLSLNRTVAGGVASKDLEQRFIKVRNKSGTTVEIRKKGRNDKSQSEDKGDNKLTQNEQVVRMNALKNLRNTPRGERRDSRFNNRTKEDCNAKSMMETDDEKIVKSKALGVSYDATKDNKKDSGQSLRRRGFVSTKIIDDNEKQSVKVKKKSYKDNNDRESMLYDKHAQLAIDAALIEASDSLISKSKKPGFHSNKANKKTKVVRSVVLNGPVSIQDFSMMVSETKEKVLQFAMQLSDAPLNMESALEPNIAELIAFDLGHTVYNNAEIMEVFDFEDPLDSLKPRPPVITIMGHVDHGKTTLIDVLRNSNVIEGECGGITQHIGAYQVLSASGKLITVIDTPGHAAFTAMRSRGAKVTDVVILVVAADDGVKEQTVEAINHTFAASVPMVIAINKMDKQGANPDRVKQDLLQHNVILEDYGGDVLSVEISAKNKTNLAELEEAVLLQAELLDLKVNYDRPASGVILESRMDKKIGVVVVLIVQKGNLKVGDIMLVGEIYCRVRVMNDSNGQKIKEVLPSTPVEVIGFKNCPELGEQFFVLKNEKEAKLAIGRLKSRNLTTMNNNDIEVGNAILFAEQKKELSLILRCDMHGSLDAIISCIESIKSDEISVNIIHKGVGSVTESDILLAKTTSSVVIGFGIRVDKKCTELALSNNIRVMCHSVIYNLIDDIRSTIVGMMKPIIKEEVIGTALVKEIFNLSRVGKIAGCYVKDGKVIKKKDFKVRLVRDSSVIYEGSMKSLRYFKEDVQEVKQGHDCGIMLEWYNDIKPGDVIEVVEVTSSDPEF